MVLGSSRADSGWKCVVQGSPSPSEQHCAMPAGHISSVVTSAQKVLHVAEGGVVTVKLLSLVLLEGLCSSGPLAGAHLHLPRTSRFLEAVFGSCADHYNSRGAWQVRVCHTPCIADGAAGFSPFAGVTTVVKKHTQMVTRIRRTSAVGATLGKGLKRSLRWDGEGAPKK